MHLKLIVCFTLLSALYLQSAEATDIVESVKSGAKSVGHSISHAAKKVYCAVRGVVTPSTPCEHKEKEKEVSAVVEEVEDWTKGNKHESTTTG